MTTNQTIDGVPRDDLELVLLHGHSTHESDQAWDRLRALLEAPAVDPDPIVGVLKNCLSEGVQPTFSGGDLKHLIRILEGKRAVQPPAVPVIHITPEVFAMLRGERKMQAGGLTYSQSKPLGSWKVPLYAEQPAPVAVVLPKRRDFSPQSDSEWGWNACLDEVARLTATVRIPEPLVMTDGLHTYEYVTGHNAAIDKMLGVKS